MTTTSDTGARAAVTPRDTRRYWRVVLAVVAPLPMLAKGVFYILSPVPGDAGFDESVAGFRAHADLVAALTWLDAVFVVLLVPATVAAAWVARRGAPRLTAVGATLSLGGFLTGFGLLGGVETPAVVTARYGLDPTVMGTLDAALEDDTLRGVASLLFIVGVVIGLGLLGVALLRSRSVPIWAALAVLLAGSTHPFVPGAVAQGVGLLVGAVGFAGVSRALLRMPDDAFDLPPVAPRPADGDGEAGRP